MPHYPSFVQSFQRQKESCSNCGNWRSDEFARYRTAKLGEVETKLVKLTEFEIPRWYQFNHCEMTDILLHCFWKWNAFDSGYGMCAYLHLVYAGGTIQCLFLIKIMTIPRLGLQAAALWLSVKKKYIQSGNNLQCWSSVDLDRLSNYSAVYFKWNKAFQCLCD